MHISKYKNSKRFTRFLSINIYHVFILCIIFFIYLYMSISKYIIEKWLLFYWTIYFYSLPLLFVFFWFWLTYVDRVHLRVKSKQYGFFIQNKIKEKISQEKIFIIKKYFYEQLNAFGEIIAGISDGLLNNESCVEIRYMQNNNSQTLISNDNKEIQTIQKILLDCETNTEIKEIKEDITKRNSDSESESEKEIITPKRLFVIGKKNQKNSIDTEILKKDIEADRNNIANLKNKRITIRKK